jgi:hypothetical protein
VTTINTTTMNPRDLHEGDEFSPDGGTTWHVCAAALFGAVAVYTDERRDPDVPNTIRVEVGQNVLVRDTSGRHPMRGVARSVTAYADEILTMVNDDIAVGQVPANVRTFDQLHRYVDANDYLEAAGVPWSSDLASDSDPAGVALTIQVQNEVTRRLNTPGRRFCTYGDCNFAGHDHTTTQGPDGGELDAPVAMFCRDCGQPTHYDEKAQDYQHDDPAAPDCFLITNRV